MTFAIYGLIGLSSFFLIIVPITGGIVLNPLLSLIVDPHTAVSMTVFFFTLNSAIKAAIFYRHIVWKYSITMLPVSVISAIIGTYAIGLAPEFLLYLIMLLMTIYFSFKKIVTLLPEYKNPIKESASGNFATSIASGFMQGAGLGGGGSLRKVYFLSNGMSLLQMHGTTSSLSVILGAVSTFVRLQTDQVTFDVLLPIVYLIPIMILATAFGKMALVRLSERISNRIIIVTLAITTVILSYKLATIL